MKVALNSRIFGYSTA